MQLKPPRVVGKKSLILHTALSVLAYKCRYAACMQCTYLMFYGMWLLRVCWTVINNRVRLLNVIISKPSYGLTTHKSITSLTNRVKPRCFLCKYNLFFFSASTFQAPNHFIVLLLCSTLLQIPFATHSELCWYNHWSTFFTVRKKWKDRHWTRQS